MLRASLKLLFIEMPAIFIYYLHAEQAEQAVHAQQASISRLSITQSPLS